MPDACGEPGGSSLAMTLTKQTDGGLQGREGDDVPEE